MGFLQLLIRMHDMSVRLLALHSGSNKRICWESAPSRCQLQFLLDCRGMLTYSVDKRGLVPLIICRIGTPRPWQHVLSHRCTLEFFKSLLQSRVDLMRLLTQTHALLQTWCFGRTVTVLTSIDQDGIWRRVAQYMRFAGISLATQASMRCFSFEPLAMACWPLSAHLPLVHVHLARNSSNMAS